jgi:hypothetical protein
MVFAGLIALATGRSIIIWSFLTYALGWWMMIPLVLLGPKPTVMADRMNRLADLIEKQNAKSKPEGYKDFNTVDDLMKQLETN